MKKILIIIAFILLTIIMFYSYSCAAEFLLNTLNIIAAIIIMLGLAILLLVLIEIIKIKILRLFEDEDLPQP